MGDRTDRRGSSRNWFVQGGREYARFRPHYPAQLAAFLASAAPGRALALDVGCGNGQLTGQLADHFTSVVGLDPSIGQIASAPPHEKIRYLCAPAEQLPLADGRVDLVTAAQAAHWFNLPAFYDEARRVAAKGAILALVSYGVPKLETAFGVRLQRFYRDEIGPYWPPERRLVEEGYAAIDFPFEAMTAPRVEIRLEWKLDELLGYIATWSAVRHAQETGRQDILLSFENDLATAWGDPNAAYPVTWAVNMRIGKI